MEEQITLKQWALTYAGMGFRVLPLVPGRKTPATSHGCKDATQDTSIIEKWWVQNPNYNIGLATGDGLFVIDIDIDEEQGTNGEKALSEYEMERGKLPKTVESRTPRGGRHLFFKTGTNIKCSTSIYHGIDIRGDGGYVVASPSVVNGKKYQWTNAPGIVEIAEADSNVFTFINPIPEDSNKKSVPFQMPEEIIEGNRTNMLVRMVGSLQAKGLSDEAIRAAVSAENETRCNPPLTDKELETTVFPALKRFQKGTAPYAISRTISPAIEKITAILQSLKPEDNEDYRWHDAGNGRLFSDLSADRLCYVPECKSWYYYDGVKWTPDTSNNAHAMDHCKNIADALMNYTVRNVVDEDRRQAYLKHVSKWQGYKYRETILKEAATVQKMCVSIADFDKNVFLFNCQNGTLDLSKDNFQFREHRSEDKITKLANVEYKPGIRCARWEQFISEVMCGDNAMALYLQKTLGYALTGDTRYECFFILYGATSRNGKGTLCETFLRLIGGYGRTANPETIAMRKNADSRAASGDLARLSGARFVNISEPDKSMTISAQLVKTLTGSDTVTARNLYEREYEFVPQFKMVINTNHLPYITDATLFTSDRIKIIPFERHFKEEERDINLKYTLTTPESLSGILNWCIEGLQMLNQSDLKVPPKVEEATREYRESSDKIGQFINEMLTPEPGAKANAKEVHTAYQNWCWQNGQKPEGYNEFRKSLASANIQLHRVKSKIGGKESKISVLSGYSLNGV